MTAKPSSWPTWADIDSAWSPTLDPIDPELCQGKETRRYAKTKAKAKPSDDQTMLRDDTEAA